MKGLLMRILLATGGFAMVAFLPHAVLARGGVYTTTKHGNTTTGVSRVAGEPVGACSHCHYEHASVGGISTGGPFDYALFAVNANTLCYTCHNAATALNVYQGSTVYNPSSHSVSSRMVWPGSSPPARPTADAGKCVNCHNPHGYKDATGLVPNMAFAREENLCYPCHDSNGPGAKDIQSQFLKSYRHPVSTSGIHSDSEGGDPTKFGTASRHSECEDCHNPHTAKADLLPPAAPTISNRLLGVSRIRVTNGLAGTVPFYTYAGPGDPSTPREYEICFKCHSSWTTQPGGQANYAVLFNSNNPSYHPVEAQGKNRNINPLAFVNGWTWDKQMFCSDCHGSDATTVEGPHGSANRYILKKPYTASSAIRTMASTESCFDCHRYDTYANTNATNVIQGYSRFNLPAYSQGHTFHVGSRRYPCYACHQSHGSTTKPALIITGRNPGINTYTQTTTGGTCAPTCHGSVTYNVNYAR
jgi:predicted CXXCH cytochrome family protein